MIQIASGHHRFVSLNAISGAGQEWNEVLSFHLFCPVRVALIFFFVIWCPNFCRQIILLGQVEDCCHLAIILVLLFRNFCWHCLLVISFTATTFQTHLTHRAKLLILICVCLYPHTDENFLHSVVLILRHRVVPN
jgi:hypothetical protein